MAHRMPVHHALGHAGARNQQGDPGNLIIHDRPLGMQAVALQAVAVIRGVDDHGLGGAGPDAVQHPAQLRVREGVAAQEPGGLNLYRVPVGLPVLPGPAFLILRLPLQGVPHIGGLGEFIVSEHGGVGLRAQARVVGLVQGHRQEEVLRPVPVQEVQGPVDAAVAEGKVSGDAFGACGAVPGGEPLFLRQLLQVAAHVVPVIRIPALRAGAQAEVVAAVQMPFPGVGRAQPRVGEALADGLYVGPQGHAVREASVGMGVYAGEQRRAGRAADRLAGIGVLVADSPFGQAVQVRRVHIRISVTSHHILAGGIRHQ